MQDANLPTENESMVLEEEIDESYEPTSEEIVEYAEYIGLDPEADKDLLYLAKEGLKAPLPSDWKPCQNRQGKIYYFNFKTKQSQWEHPCDEYYKKLAQEMKRKKQEKGQIKPPMNKTKSSAVNLPLAKQESLPLAKTGTGSNPSYHQSLEASFSADNQTSFAMDHKMSFSNDNQENNSLTDKKFEGKVLPSEFENFQTLGSESGIGYMDDDQDESEFKLFEYQKVTQDDIDKRIKTYKEIEKTIEKQLKQKLEKELQDMKTELKKTYQNESCRTFIQEKEVIRNNMRSEYKKKAEDAIRKLENEYNAKKRDLESSEARKLKEDIILEEELIKDEYEAKRNALQEEKKKLELERQKIKAKEQSEKARLEEALEKEKKEIIEDYTNLLREAEAEELHAQKQEIQKYCNELEDKLAEEKKTLMLAKRQKESINLTRRSELNELYERRLKLEQEKIDNEITKSLREYEEKEKKRKDEEFAKLKNMELNHEKEQRLMQKRNELQDLKSNYNKRLENYQQVLKNKFRKEKALIDKEFIQSIENHKSYFESVTLNINTREEMTNQINKVNMYCRDMKKEVSELESKIESQRDENDQLKERMGILQKEKKAYDQKIIDEVKKKIKDTENEISKLTEKKERRNEMPRQRPRSLQNIAKLNSKNSKSTTTLGAIKQNVEEIKSFLTKREGSNPSMSKAVRRTGYESSRMSETSSKHIQGFNLKMKGINSPSRKGSVTRYEEAYGSKTQREWPDIISEEENKLYLHKRELEGERTTIKIAHDQIAKERDRYKHGYPPLMITEKEDKAYYRKDGLRRHKSALNTKISHLNNSIAKLKEEQSVLKTRERSLKNLKKAIEQHDNEEIESSDLDAIYQNHQSTATLERPSLESRPRPSVKNHGGILSNRESHKFFKKWRESMNPRGTTDSETESSQTQDERTTLTYRPFGKENFRGNVSREKSQRMRPNDSYMASKVDMNYNSLIDVLEMKVRHSTNLPNRSFIQQTEVTGSRETRIQAGNVFSKHSQWLKDMKDQLNKHLYEKPTKGTVFFMK